MYLLVLLGDASTPCEVGWVRCLPWRPEKEKVRMTRMTVQGAKRKGKLRDQNDCEKRKRVEGNSD